MTAKWIGKIGFFNRMTVAVWLVGLALVFGAFVRVDSLYRQELKVRTEKTNWDNSNWARSLGENVNHTFFEADSILQFMKTAIEANGGIDPAHQELLKKFQVKGDLSQIAVADARGDLVFSAAPLTGPLNISDREHFKAHNGEDTKQLFIATVRITEANGVSSIFLSRRINDANGGFAGIVSVGISQDHFANEFRRLNIGPDESIVLIRNDGSLLARIPPMYAAEEASYFKHHVVLSHIDQGVPSGVFQAPGSSGEPRMAAFQALSDYPVFVMVSIPQEVVVRDVESRHRQYRSEAAIFSFLLLTTLFLVSWLGRKHYQTQLALQVSDQERKAQEDAIHRMAYYDSLTGLPNRAFLMEHLNEEMAMARKGEAAGAVLFVDVDRLKRVNDTYGHSAGDKLIIMTGKQIVAAVGEEAVVARIGGDEFVVLLSGANDREKVDKVAGRLINLLSRNYDIGDASVHMAASVGVALYPEDGDTTDDIYKHADLALYAAKEGGKNTWRFFMAEMQEAVTQKMLLKRDLHGAIERGELFLHYQPIVEMGGQRIAGFEALLRWASPEHGLVSPAQFIPLAEENEMILRIGKWVLEEACLFARRLSDTDKGKLRVAVNVSPRQLATDDFVDIVRNAVRSSGIRPEQLEIEVTENVLIASLEDGSRKLDELRAFGVGISLDDFGTGFSSLTRLRLLPVNTLKLDKSFIDKLLPDDTQLPYVRSIVDMAKILGLAVVAEGVETKDQLEKLMDCRCDYIQGFLFSRPMPEEEALRFLNKDERAGI